MSLAVPGLRRVACCAASAVLLGSLAACGSASASASGPATVSTLSTKVPAGYNGSDKGHFDILTEPKQVPGTSFEVGFLNTNAGQSSLFAMQNAAKAEVERLGGSFIALDASSDPQKQASQMNQVIAQKVDVIIVDPTVATALGPGITRAQAAGIPVIAIGTPPDQSKPQHLGFKTSISQGFDYSVYRTMKALADEHPGATFATMGLSIPVDQLIFMLNRIQYWGEQFGLKFEGKVDTPNDNPLGFGPATSTILGKYPDVDFIVTFNDESAVAAASTVTTSGKGAKIVTPNAAQPITRDAMKAGRLQVVYRVPWEQQGVQSVWAAYDILTEQNLPLPEFITVPGYTVTTDEVNEASWLK
jgi:ribose transport system substrate-binding protein